ncbi:MAG: D-alanine--D-alanine ligase [Muribaculaceae bacterium]|nr:D-alanine--D-alanine ligase [Muribaculaceae bacterium]
MKTKVAVFFGGRSVEHEISVISALQAINAFDKEKYEVIPVYISKQGKWFTGQQLLEISNYKDLKGLETKVEEVYMKPIYGDYKIYRSNLKGGIFSKKDPVVADIHVAFPVLHGSHGEDGMFQGILETIGIPFVGCDTLSSANGMDKITMKMILRESGIPVVDYVWFTDREWLTSRESVDSQIETDLGYPVIVKPANLGSSVGISKASDRKSLDAAIENAIRFSTRIIVEHMVQDMKEINCSVLGDADHRETSVCEEPIKHKDFLTYQEKYGGGEKSGMQSSQKKIPADIPAEVSSKIQELASQTFRVLACNGVSRIDFMIDNENGDIFVNEINTIPGSLSYYLWEETGIGFSQLIDKLISLALKRKRDTDRKTFSYDTNIFSMGKGLKGGLKGGAKGGNKIK